MVGVWGGETAAEWLKKNICYGVLAGSFQVVIIWLELCWDCPMDNGETVLGFETVWHAEYQTVTRL